MNYVSGRLHQPNIETAGPKTAICGSFRRDRPALERDFAQLRAAGCIIVSPSDIDFVVEVDGFVYAAQDEGKSSAEIEELHLRSMRDADFVWLHCPGGYVGTSAAMELGFARALGLRVFAAERPKDVTLAGLVQLCGRPQEAVDAVQGELGDAPAEALIALQGYYARAATRRGWSEETTELALGFLRDEVTELEEALSGTSELTAASLELADVQLYVVHLANILGIDLGAAVRRKERINTARFDHSLEKIAA